MTCLSDNAWKRVKTICQHQNRVCDVHSKAKDWYYNVSQEEEGKLTYPKLVPQSCLTLQSHGL